MKVFVVYCHPHAGSFTHQVLERFTAGLQDAGHEVRISDLYAMDFRTDLTEEEYLRETYYRSDLPLAPDVLAEQEKIQWCDGIVFVYPVFWTEAPAKLVGWFDRVWTSGYAYTPNPTMKKLRRVLCIACAGKTLDALRETGELQAMETVMLGDRIRERAEQKQMLVLDGITHWNESQREVLLPRHLETAYCMGRDFGVR